MSQSEPLPTARIEVEAHLGTAITLADGGFATLERTTTRLGTDLPDGVYSLTLSEGDLARQWIVRLHAGQTWRYPEDVPADELGKEGTPADPLSNAQRTWLSGKLTGLRSGGATEIVVVVSSPDFDATASLERSIRLLNENDRTCSPERVLVLEGGHTLVRYVVSPGLHRVGFESFERKRMEQTVFAIGGRRTIVLMEYGQASIVEKVKGAARIKKRRGVDPARTMVVSHGPEVSAAGLSDQIRLAGILLYLLRTRVAPADIGIARALIEGEVDPYLRLYAALAGIVLPGTVLQRLATSLDKRVSDQNSPAEVAARRLLAQLSHQRGWPDLICLGWRLGDQTDEVLTSLPMLEVNWRWASTQSVREGRRQVISPNVTATAARADASAAPWLAVRVAHSPSVAEDADDMAELMPVLTLVANKVAEALGANEAIQPGATPGNETGSFLDVAWLTPMTGRLVQSIMQTGGTGLWASGNPALLLQLAASLGEPIGALAQTIRTASRELRELLDKAASNPDKLWNSDPHKGMFGGRPESRGAKVEIELVTERDDYESLALQLAVTTGHKARPLSGHVTFYLHPTFSPSVEMVPVINGVAHFSFHAWGAFTIGVETADGRRLELDLALQSILPQTFRAR